MFFLLLDIVIGIGQEEAVPGGLEGILDAAYLEWAEGVGDIGNHQTATAARAKEAIMVRDERPYQHVVFFKFREQAKEETVRSIEQAFRELTAKLPFVAGLEWGRNSSPEKLNHGFTHCFIVTFRDEKGRDTYLPHPDHQAFCREYLDPNLEDVCVLDFRVED